MAEGGGAGVGEGGAGGLGHGFRHAGGSVTPATRAAARSITRLRTLHGGRNGLAIAGWLHAIRTVVALQFYRVFSACALELYDSRLPEQTPRGDSRQRRKETSRLDARGFGRCDSPENRQRREQSDCSSHRHPPSMAFTMQPF